MFRTLECGNLRCFARFAVALAAQGQWLVGANGVGKTTVLEGLAALATGRSFRASQGSPLLREGADEGWVRGESDDRHGWRERRMVIGRSGRVWLEDGEEIHAAAGLRSPALVLTSTAAADLGRSRAFRRAWLWWFMFHVEPSFAHLWADYRHLLAQRNAALARSDRAAVVWEEALAPAGEQVWALTTRWIDAWQTAVAAVEAIAGWPGLVLEARPGWSGGLADSLVAHRARDQHHHLTSVGPHRADLGLRWRGRFARAVSTGQQKRAALIGLAAQAQLLADQGRQALLLIDDATAGLDRDGHAGLERMAATIPGQWLMAAPERPAATTLPWFHVEPNGVQSASKTVASDAAPAPEAVVH